MPAYPHADIEPVRGQGKFYQGGIEQLRAVIRQRFTLDYPRKEGPLRKHLEARARINETLDERLIPVEIPRGFEYLIDHYMKLRTGEHLTYTELQAYCELTGVLLSPLEISAIMALDNEANSVITEIIADKPEVPDGGTE